MKLDQGTDEIVIIILFKTKSSLIVANSAGGLDTCSNACTKQLSIK